MLFRSITFTEYNKRFFITYLVEFSSLRFFSLELDIYIFWNMIKIFKENTHKLSWMSRFEDSSQLYTMRWCINYSNMQYILPTNWIVEVFAHLYRKPLVQLKHQFASPAAQHPNQREKLSKVLFMLGDFLLCTVQNVVCVWSHRAVM